MHILLIMHYSNLTYPLSQFASNDSPHLSFRPAILVYCNL